jgi:hypothetical protein
MTSTIFWYIKPYSPLEVNRRFEEHIVKAGGKQIGVPPICRLAFNGLLDVISQKTVLVMTTAVRTSYPTSYLSNLRFQEGEKGILCVHF